MHKQVPTAKNQERYFQSYIQTFISSVRSSSETRRIDPNQDTTFLVESVIPRGKYGKAYGKSFLEIYKIDSQYLHWLETTDRLFRIDFDKLKELCPDAENSINKSVGENN